jgi:hypothetical protein
MTTAEPLQITPVAASIENPGDWDTLAAQLAVGTAMPTVLTPDLISGTIAGAVPLLFGADAAGNVDLLRGTFSDVVVAQCSRNLGCLMGARPVSVVVHLVGSRVVDGHPILRAHLSIQTQEANGSSGVQNQFWDLQCGAQVTVGQQSCPNCGAPIAPGELLCRHCHADVRSVVEVPLVVSKLELY